VSNNSVRVVALAGAAALAGLGYTLGRRSASRAARSPRVPTSPVRRIDARSPESSPPSTQPASRISELAPRAERFSADVSAGERDRRSSTPDALDVALNLGDLFDVESASGVELTARISDRASRPHSRDDDDAPAPEDLGRMWLEQATESEHSLGVLDTIPDIENVPKPRRTLLEGEALEGEALEGEALGDEDDDETTAEYVRRHRLSSAG
jgi:hypothetical protein